jgi:hypothetical protein
MLVRLIELTCTHLGRILLLPTALTGYACCDSFPGIHNRLKKAQRPSLYVPLQYVHWLTVYNSLALSLL